MSTQRLAEDFDNFLQLLTVQLQYQDPLAPMDSNQFTQQLVSFTGVEQSIAANKNLEKLINQNNASEITNAVGYLGKEITVNTNVAGMAEDGTVSWSYTLGASTNSTKITIKDQNGFTIDTVNGELGAGAHQFIWQAPEGEDPGTYSIEIEALSGNDEAVAHEIYSKGIVTSVEKVAGEIMLASNGILTAPGNIVAVKEVTKKTIPEENGTV
jgi:flagellar basal-body rod modification protein FlgD